MTTLEIWLLAISLAMDCFTVSITSGIIMRRICWRTFFIMAFFFGLFQAVMPFIGCRQPIQSPDRELCPLDRFWVIGLFGRAYDKRELQQ